VKLGEASATATLEEMGVDFRECFGYILSYSFTCFPDVSSGLCCLVLGTRLKQMSILSPSVVSLHVHHRRVGKLHMLLDSDCVMTQTDLCHHFQSYSSEISFETISSGGEIEPIQVDTFCVMLIESTFIKERISRISQCKFLKCVHPTVQFDDDSSAEVGEGTTIEHHTYIGCNVKIGRHCHIGSGCIIAHDTIIEDFCFLGQACLVAGAVRIGKGATLRSACVVAPKCSVGAWTEIGTHSAVISHIDSGICAQGIPALEINC